MSPLPGIYASAITGNLSQPAFQGDYWALNTVTLTGGTATVVFTGVPSEYTHLQIRAIAPVGNYITGKLQFNSDTGANYSRHTLLGNGGGTAQATAATSQTYISIGADNGFGRANYPYAMVWDLIDYKNVTKYKTVRLLAGFDTNNTDGGEVCLQSGLWMSTAPISTITFSLTSGSYPANTSFGLYGVK